MRIEINVMSKGDEVINVTSEFIAIKRKKGTVDLLPLLKEGECWRVDLDNVMTIGYGENVVTMTNENGVSVSSF